MKNLDYKGIKSTRLMAAIVLTLLAIIFFAKGMFTADQWIDFVKWVWGFYFCSEVGAKGASAYAGRDMTDGA